MRPIITLCLIALYCAVCQNDVTQAAGITHPKNKNEMDALEAVVGKWSSWGGANRAARRRSAILTAKVGESEARIDLQDVEQIQHANFDRLNIQIDGRSLASVHIQQNQEFGVALIRQSFLESEKHGAHVFLSGPEITNINPPGDGNRYSSKTITRKWKGKTFKTKIWSTRSVLTELAKFDKSTIKK